MRAAPEAGGWKVLGFDAAGVVVAAGPEATLFRPGDAVYYAGSIARPGTNAEFHLVDERIVGRKPPTLGWAEAAALPLTAITAWEMLFDRLEIRRPVPGAAPAVLIIGGAGGVGSMAVQLAAALTDLTVIATASRPESRAWASDARRASRHRPRQAARGAGRGARARRAGVRLLDHPHRRAHRRGRGADRAAGALRLHRRPAGASTRRRSRRKSVSIRLESMFTRPVFATADMAAQHDLLDEVARLVDAGSCRTHARRAAERRSPPRTCAGRTR